MATQCGVHKQQRVIAALQVRQRLSSQTQSQHAQRSKPSSGFFHLGSEGTVLLSNGFVVLQNLLQVSHRFVSVFGLNLWTVSGASETRAKLQISAVLLHFKKNTKRC